MELRLALRTLSKTPSVTIIAVISLALGIGATSAIYSLFNQMLLRPLPVADPAQLVNLSAPGPKPGSQSCNDAGDCDVVFSYRMFRDIEAGAPKVAIVNEQFAKKFNLGHDAVGKRMKAGSGTEMDIEIVGVTQNARMVLRQVAWMTSIGGVAGMACAIGLGRLAESLLFELKGSDPVVLLSSAVLLGIVALGAGFIPAHRASRVDPMSALRYQ